MVSHFVDSVHLCYMSLLKKGVISFFFLISTCMGCTNGVLYTCVLFHLFKDCPLGCTNVNVVLPLHYRSVGDIRLQLKIILKQRFSENQPLQKAAAIKQRK